MNQFQNQHQLTNALLAAAAMLNQRQHQLHNNQQQQQQQVNVARQTKTQSNSQVQAQTVNKSNSSTPAVSSQQSQTVSKQSTHTNSLPVQSPQLTNSMPPKKRRSVSPPVDASQSAPKRICANNSISPSVSMSNALPVTSHHSNITFPSNSINLVRPTFPTSSITSTQSSPRKRNSCSSESSPPDSNNNTLDTNQNDLNSDLLDFDSDDDEVGERKGKQGQRNYRKMIIEKRRRDRINHSLNELRRLVPAAFERTGSAKLEKAEILQLTVEHLKQLRAKLKESESPKPSVDYHTIGFQECADEVARFLTNQEKINLQEQVRTRVLSHLTNFNSEIPSSPTLSPTLPNLNQARVPEQVQQQQNSWPLPLAHWLNTSKPISPASSSAVSPVNSTLSSSSSSPVVGEQSSRSSSVSSAPEAHVSSTQPLLAPQVQLSRVGRAKSLCRQVQQNSMSSRQSSSTSSSSSSSQPTIKAQSTLANNIVAKQLQQQHLLPQLQQPQLGVPQVMQRINPLLLDAQSQLILAAQQRIAAINQSTLTNQSSNNRAPLNLSLTSTLY